MKLEMVVNDAVLVIDGEFTVQMRPVSVAAVPAAPVSVPVTAPASVRAVAPSVPPAVPAAGGDLFARLSGLRRELAAANGVPPYVVFKDQTLKDMADQMPQSLDELGSIPGVGAAKLEKYGNKFLALIRAEA